jgi:phosphoketolase
MTVFYLTTRPLPGPPYTTSMDVAAATVRQQMVDKRVEHHDYVRRTGEDLPEVRDWVWPSGR